MSCKHGNWAPCELCDAESTLELRIEELELERDALLEQLEEARANARLIAAAPDLLAELKSIHDWAVLERAPLRKQEIESIRKVIAKATGEQP